MRKPKVTALPEANMRLLKLSGFDDAAAEGGEASDENVGLFQAAARIARSASAR